jgi:SAM-dependent methyltransferase
MNGPITSTAEQCWCGCTVLTPSPHADYLVCKECGTAKLRERLVTGQNQVEDEQSHFYGEQYWYDHQRGQSYSPLPVRARTDMTDRNQHWLRYLLKYRMPPGKTLEIGCAHGSFVKLLNLAGFEAMGMEMSPAVLAKARQWFAVQVVAGPIESADGELGSFDIVMMFDVIEHFARPLQTMQQIVRYLSDDGLIVIQTPLHEAISDGTWSQFKPPEHTFLFSLWGIRALLATLGFEYIDQEPAIFQDDMFVFASRRPLATHSPQSVSDCLSATPDGRLVLAMQDMYWHLRERQQEDLASRYGVQTLGRALLRAIPRAIKRRLTSGFLSR